MASDVRVEPYRDFTLNVCECTPAGVVLLAYLLRACRLPSSKAAAALLTAAVAYDLCWALVQPALTASPSIMLQ
eukprot:1994434-Pyramimonas_sp.AAC.1